MRLFVRRGSRVFVRIAGPDQEEAAAVALCIFLLEFESQKQAVPCEPIVDAYLRACSSPEEGRGWIAVPMRNGEAGILTWQFRTAGLLIWL